MATLEELIGQCGDGFAYIVHREAMKDWHAACLSREDKDKYIHAYGDTPRKAVTKLLILL